MLQAITDMLFIYWGGGGGGYAAVSFFLCSNSLQGYNCEVCEIQSYSMFEIDSVSHINGQVFQLLKKK